MTIRYFILVFSLVNFLYSEGQSTWFVSTGGEDSNSGLSADDSFATVNQGINNAQCGDSIVVLSGTYHEKINAYLVCPEDNRVVIQGDVDERPLIIGDSTQFNKYAIGASGSGFVFRHFELTSPYPFGCEQSNMVVVGKGDYFDFIDVIVHHSGYDGIKTIADCETDNFPIGWRIIDSQIHSNGLGCPASVVNGDGIDFTNCQNCLIENSIIRDNMGHQIQVKLQADNVTIQNSHIEGINMLQIGLPGSTPQCDPDAYNSNNVFIRHNTMLAKGDTSGFVIKMADVHNLWIENNTIVKDSAGLDVGFICFGGCGSADNWQNSPTGPIVIKNNIFYSRADEPFYAGPDTTFFDPLGIFDAEVASLYNLFFDIHGEYVTPPDGSPTSTVADPVLCDFPLSYGLHEISPCIDGGDPLSPDDPDGTPNDQGAIYYQTPCKVGVNDLSKNLVLVYPNPTSGLITLEVETISGNDIYIILDVSGREISRQLVRSPLFQVDLGPYSPGLYLGKMLDDQGKLTSTEVVIKE